MARVLHLASPSAVDCAWSDYAELCRIERDDPCLSHDRAHVEARIRAHDRFQRLFLATERRDNVVLLGRWG
ncbi:MAG: hypothetical protein H0W39_07640 [Sphingomonas sp.]|nr:hypothetical protein [Sphingomonas sp.]